MKVIVCGAGQVGTGIAERLAGEGNDVSMIDVSPTLVQRANEHLDVRAIVGHGAHPDVLEEAGAREADMMIAVTLHDEVNMVACQVAHTLFDIPTKIARVRAQTYLQKEWAALFSRDHMGIDFVISPEIEVGEAVLRRLALPGAFESVPFMDGRVSVVGLHCGPDCPVIDTPLRQLSDLFPDLPAVILAVVRKGRLFVPHGADQLHVDDDCYFAAPAEQIARTIKIFGHEETHARHIVIAGGGNIGLYVAKALEERDPSTRVKLIESNRMRAEAIAEQLERTVVLSGSALSEELLREADATTADLAVTLTNDDQVNLLSSVLAKQLGCRHSMALISNSGYAGLLRGFGIDAQIDPKAVTISRVLQHVRRGRIRAIHSIHNGAGEFIEAEVLETAPVLGRTLRELGFGDGVRFGAILRDGKVLAPHGHTELETKDRVMLFAKSEHVREIEQLFRVSLEFF